MGALKRSLEQVGQRVELIDQGRKFRAMGKVALRAGQPLDGPDGPARLDDFIRSTKAQKASLAVLDKVSRMDEAAVKAYLYTPEISRASGEVGKVPSVHEVAVRLLRTQVEDAVEAKANVILIDGRGMEKYARQFTKEGVAQFVMGWHFKCEPPIAARRSLGLFEELETLRPEDKSRLHAEIWNISDRNKSDISRAVDPLREPTYAYHLDLSTYAAPGSDVPYRRAHDILHGGGMAVVDTSYTTSIEEMTGPITELSMLGLLIQGALSHQDVGIETVSA